MSMKLAELRDQRDTKSNEAKNLLDSCPRDHRMPKTTADKIDCLLFEVEGIDREITRTLQATGEQLNGGFNARSDTFDDGAAQIRVLRNVDDIRRHYRAENVANSSDDRIDLVNFFRGVAGLKTTPAVKNALSEGTSSAGGFAVPSILMPNILEALHPASSLLTAGAGIVPLGDQAKTFTTAAISTLPTAAWRLESGAVAVSDPTFRAVVSTPQSLSFMFRISRELLADAPNLQAALSICIGAAFAKELDRSGLRGTGALPEPRGISNTGGIQILSNGANGLSLSSYANFLSAYSAILSADAPAPTAAIMSPRSLIKLAGLLDTTNQPLDAPTLLEPMKMIATSQIPNTLTVGTSTDCSELYVADFKSMLFMMRESLHVQLLLEKYADTGELAFVCHARADIALTYPAQFAVVTGVRP